MLACIEMGHGYSFSVKLRYLILLLLLHLCQVAAFFVLWDSATDITFICVASRRYVPR